MKRTVALAALVLLASSGRKLVERPGRRFGRGDEAIGLFDPGVSR
jgi:hypothetical protein